MRPILLRLASTGGGVLCFHSVTAPGLRPSGVAQIAADRLDALLAGLALAAEVIPLREMLARNQAGRSTRGLIALTFDDAYRSLLTEATPVFRKRGTPITVFPVTSYLDGGRAFWWDRVDQLFERLSAPDWRRVEDELHLPREYREGQPAEFGALRPLRQWMLRHFEGCQTPEVDAALSRAESASGVRTAERSMTPSELQQFVADLPVDLGVHTDTHPVLPLLPPDQQRREISSAFTALRERFPATLPVLAIPFGLFDRDTARIAREAGMTATLSLSHMTLPSKAVDNPLPRFSMTRDSTPLRLVLRLTGWFDRAETAHPPVLPSAVS